MTWCEDNEVGFVLGLAKNERLKARLSQEMTTAEWYHAVSDQPCRLFKAFIYQTRDSWRRPRRVIGKAEHLAQGANPRFVVTSLTQVDPRALYEQLYCARGDMENRIKEQQARPVCRPDQHGDAACQSAAPVFLVVCLRADVRLAPAWVLRARSLPRHSAALSD